MGVGAAASQGVVGSNNTGVGVAASDAVAGSFNTGVGYSASNAVTGGGNTALGAFAGSLGDRQQHRGGGLCRQGLADGRDRHRQRRRVHRSQQRGLGPGGL